MRAVWSGAAGAVFPRICPRCSGVAYDGGSPCCEACTRELSGLITDQYCRRCGADAGLFELTERRCPQCRTQGWSLAGIVRVAKYEQVMGDLIRRFKYARGQQLDAFLSGLLAAAIAGAPWAGELQMLVPIPSPWQRRWSRGFWPTGLLADGAARRLGVPRVRLLTTTRYWPRQVAQESPAQRRENVRGVFRVRPTRLDDRPPVCLIEDVSTTGATINEAARTLRRAGFTRVYAAILARAVRR